MTTTDSTMNNATVVGCGCAACKEAFQNPNYINDSSDSAAPPSSNGPDQILSGSVWNNDGNGITLTYNFWNALPSYYNSGDEEATGFKAFSAQQELATVKALELIETITNITFVETTQENETDLGFAQSNLDPDAGAWAYYPSVNPKGGDVWTNRLYVNETGLNEGTYHFYTILHEIGHALGLQHTFTGGLTGAQNTEQYSVMAYDTAVWGNLYAGGYQLYDVWALQELYGANTTYNNGDNVYVLPVNKTLTIWDTGGNDTLDASSHSADVVLNLEAGTFSSTGSYTDHITIAYDVLIENATGGSGNDVLYGNQSDNVLLGQLGNDVLYGDAGNDTLDGGAGTDEVIFTTNISDFLIQIIDSATATITDLVGDYGVDTLISIENFTFNNTTYNWEEFQSYAAPLGTIASKFVVDSGFYQHYSGGFNTETLTASQMGYAAISGDVVTFNREVSGLYITIENQQGPSSLELSGSDEIDKIIINGIDDDLNTSFYGGLGNDEITINVTGNDRLFGQAGNDIMHAGVGADILAGGAGEDTLSGGSGNDYLYGGDGNDVLNGDDGNDRAVGNIGDDIINGGAGDDVLLGQDGNDIISGDSGNDLIGGGSGIDTLNGGAGMDTLYGNDGEDILNGGDDNDTIYGGNENDTLNGDAGDDVLNGGAGDDVLNGGDDNDTLYGAAGNDTLNGDGGDDRLNGNAGDDTLNGGTGVDILNGGDGNDTLSGNDGVDTIYGGNGLDQIFGGDGNDILRGNGGNDTIYGQLDSDNILGGGGHDFLYGDEGDDTIRGEDHNDRLYGGDGIDLLYGDAGTDLLQGDAGNDYLDGGSGVDYLSGGSGADRFNFRMADFGTGVDRILDFTTADGDRIDLRELLSSFNSGTDNIADFLIMTDNASNSTISIDIDGAAGGVNFQDVVSINGGNGLDLNTLITDGNILI